VALARALAVEPKVLLLDEPFGALDAKVRQGLRDWLRKLHEEIHLTSVLVTHDQEEALEVADRVVIMNQARIEQVGTPEEVFHRPASQFVIEFLGQVNMFHARVGQGRAIVGDLAIALPELGAASMTSATVYMRPHELSIRRTATGESAWPARIVRVHPAGAIVKITLLGSDGTEIRADIGLDEFQQDSLAPGDDVYVYPKNARVFLNQKA
jgi:sulfate transport system ATP-binding protein